VALSIFAAEGVLCRLIVVGRDGDGFFCLRCVAVAGRADETVEVHDVGDDVVRYPAVGVEGDEAGSGSAIERCFHTAGGEAFFLSKCDVMRTAVAGDFYRLCSCF